VENRRDQLTQSWCAPLPHSLYSLPPGGTKDVLLGRGASIRDHPGNEAFRALVIGRKADFNRARKLKKRDIAIEIIQHVKDNNGRFLTEEDVVSGKSNGRNRTWVVVEEAKALQKTMHRLREKEWVSKSGHSARETVSVEPGKDEPECQNIEPRAIQGPSSPEVHNSAPLSDELAHDATSGSDDDDDRFKEEFLDEHDSDLDELGSVQDGQLVQYLQDKLQGNETSLIDSMWDNESCPSWNSGSGAGGLDQLDLNASVEGVVNTLHQDARNSKKRFTNVPPSGSQEIDLHHNRIVSNLVNASLPASVCGLVKNLLDCSQKEFRGNESYSSFDDVLADLKLIRDKPGCYLEGVGNSTTISVPNKLYGRQDDVDKITGLFIGGACKGLVVNGRAGVGKSSLLSQVFSDISKQNDSYFVQTKFEQSGINPLAIVASVFNSLCEAFAEAAPSRTKEVVARELESALGVAGINALSLIIPRLSKILESPDLDSTDHYMNQAASVSYSFRKLLEIISSHSAPITLLFDDLQFVSKPG